MEKTLQIVELASEELRAIVGECELTGRRTIFERNDRPVAVLLSYDEYLALRETIAIGADDALRARIDAADEEVRRNKIMAMEDLLES
ncbi:MAG: type II toxin-antitoxin system Phd/YefM family antitoxin [Thermoanaerobaculia bacterium]